MKTRKGPALFLSITNREIFEECESRLPRLFPELQFVFLRTFDGWTKWRPPNRKGKLLPTSRLLLGWISMNETTSREIKHYFRKEKKTQKRPVVLVINGYGRDVYHYAIKYVFCSETLEFHKVLVRVRLIQQGVSPPLYLLVRPTGARFIEADMRYFADKRQRKHYFAANAREGRLAEVISIVRKRVKPAESFREAA